MWLWGIGVCEWSGGVVGERGGGGGGLIGQSCWESR